MELKNILLKLLPSMEELSLPDWLSSEVNDDGSVIKSYVWRWNNLRRIRLCELNLQNKFIAESLVIYPDYKYIHPVFGTEYVECGGRRFFGTIDFHPMSMSEDYIDKYINNNLKDQPDRAKNKSNIYDLDKYFSKKLWIRSTTDNFYQEYLKSFKLYLERYIISTAKLNPSDEGSGHSYQKGYDYHLASTDPAYGILKTYYNEEFANKYINTFLFDLAKQ
tara:strand:- start:834 stop:1493 length:660 start_codon:yes stop_codon:yes gene_type:complete